MYGVWWCGCRGGGVCGCRGGGDGDAACCDTAHWHAGVICLRSSRRRKSVQTGAPSRVRGSISIPGLTGSRLFLFSDTGMLGVRRICIHSAHRFYFLGGVPWRFGSFLVLGRGFIGDG